MKLIVGFLVVLGLYAFVGYTLYKDTQEAKTNKVTVPITVQPKITIVNRGSESEVLMDWTRLYKQAWTDKEVVGAIELEYVDKTGGIDVYLMDRSKSVRVVSLWSYLPNGKERFALSFTKALKQFDTASDKMKLVIKSRNIIGREPEKPRITVYDLVID